MERSIKNNAVKITLSKCQSSEETFSHLFGDPILPQSLLDTVNDLDADVMFFGQFDLSEIAPFDTENKLPHQGFLYLFLDTAIYPYEAKTFYSTEEPLYIIEDFNSEIEDVEGITTPFAMSFSSVGADADGTKLFGTPSFQRDDEEEVFMQFDPLDNQTGFLSYIDGYAYFTFADAKRTLQNLRFSMEYS